MLCEKISGSISKAICHLNVCLVLLNRSDKYIRMAQKYFGGGFDKLTSFSKGKAHGRIDTILKIHF